MNDHSELMLGMRHLNVHKQQITSVLDEAFCHLQSNFGSHIWDAFFSEPQKLLWNTFIGCFSEHSPSEDMLGRLSMWRAYGRNAGVAFVFRADVLAKCFELRSQWATPVSYVDDGIFASELEIWAQTVRANFARIKTMSAEEAEEVVNRILTAAIVSIKHIGFEEEREWRAIVTPNTLPKDCKRIVQAINGTPQPIYTMPLMFTCLENENNIRFQDLIERIIIGPCQYPVEVLEAIVQTLEEANIPYGSIAVHPSEIPLRHNS